MFCDLGIAILTAIAGFLNQDKEATLLFAGDAMQHQSQIDAARRSDGSYDYSGYYDNIASLISDADYAVVNLETPVAGGRYSGYPMFNAPFSYAAELRDAGFDLFLTANNHTLDRHDAGLVRTIEALDSLRVDHIGTYANSAARQQTLPMVRDINGFKVGFLNYTYGTNGIQIQGDVVVDYINRDVIAKDIADLRAAGAELLCVAVHWGVEYKLLPHPTQRSLADYLLSQGVDMIIGGHPHVIQPFEIRTSDQGRKQLLVWSLGNFVSGMKTRDTRGGAIVRAYLRRDDHGVAYVDAADYDLVFTVPGSRGGDNYRLIFADSCQNMPRQADCRAFVKAATDIFDKYNVDVPHRRASTSSKH